MSDSLISDSYSDINLSSALLQTPDSATDVSDYLNDAEAKLQPISLLLYVCLCSLILSLS